VPGQHLTNHRSFSNAVLLITTARQLPAGGTVNSTAGLGSLQQLAAACSSLQQLAAACNSSGAMLLTQVN